MFGKKKTKAENIQEETYDPYLLEQIQPSGGITFQDTRYVETGTGYETCIHVYDFPQKLDDFWMAKVCNINNTVVTVDISTDNVMEVQKNINRSMKEQQYRYMEAQNFQEKYDAKQRFQEMERLYEEISSLGEVIKLLHIRIFVADHSYRRLEEKVKNILAKLESNGFRAAIFLNETKTEWESMYRPYKEQQSEDLFFIYGQPLTSNALAAGNPFHFSSLQDPCGDFLGKTPCGGNVFFDEFHKSKTRRSYSSLVIGTMGSGKSTLLKKRDKTNAIKGNYVRAFDISGEFTRLTKTLGGKVLKLDGTNGILNPLEVLKAEEGEEISFTRHISKVSTIYKFLTEGSADTEEVIEFEELLRELYKTFGMELVGGKVKSQVTRLPANRYPTFSDLLAYIERKMEEIVYDVEQYVMNAQEIADEIRKIQLANNAVPVIYAPGYNPKSDLVMHLTYQGIKAYIFSDNLTEKKEELRAAIEGKTTDYFSVEEEPEEVAEKKAAGAAKAIGIAGAVPRMGTTTQAIQLVKYLRYKGYKACYIEMNDHGYVEELIDSYEGVEVEEVIGKAVYQEVEMYYKLEKLPEVLKRDYDYFVYDYGVFSDRDFNKISFLEKDLQIFTVGTKPGNL